MKKILIGGYYGYGNVGDEAILEAIAQQLKGYPEIDVTVLSANIEYTLKTQGLKAVSRNNPISVIGSITASDLFVQGGGGLIQDSTSFRSPHFYLCQLMLCHFLATPYFIMGQGIGPVNCSFTRFLTRELFGQAKAVVVRDSASQSFLLSSFPKDFDLSVASDLALLLNAADDDEGEDILYDENLADLPQPILAVTVKGNPKDSALVSHFSNALNTYMDEHGGSVIMIPFFPKYDIKFAERVLSGLTRNGGIVRKHHKPSAILALYKQMSHILAGRLHAVVFAAMAGRSFTPLVYDPKMNYFLNLIDTKNEIVTPMIGAKSIEEPLLNDIENSEILIDKVKKRLPPLQKQAELNISKLFELLGLQP